VVLKIHPAFTFETKARTLEKLAGRVTRFRVPYLIYFSVEDWRVTRNAILDRIMRLFGDEQVIVRSSAWDEDGSHWGLAGQYQSIPHISPKNRPAVTDSVETVIRSYSKNADRNHGRDEVIVQKMVLHPVMSGVLFTHDLNTGAPYYVINYDDESGQTDTVTSGSSEYANRTLYVHRGAVDAVRSPRFRALLEAVAELENITGSKFLDIEFAVDGDLVPYLFQARLITTQANWNRAIALRVDLALEGVARLLRSRLRPLSGVRGQRAVFGQMPDWNPAEMIGRAPRRLASSLYRYLITDHVWRDARAEMGYGSPTGQPLMVLLAGQPFIDVRLSFNSYLPADLPIEVGDKLVNGWLDRLRANPHLHDKVEFEIAITAYTFDIDEKIENLVSSSLNAAERNRFKASLARLTRNLVTGERASISGALEQISQLEQLNNARDLSTTDSSPITIMAMLEECIRLGTIPFSILARHAFIARSFLLSLVNVGVFSESDAERFSRSIRTVASEIVSDIRRLALGHLEREQFMRRYGHLRPGTYDILSPRYDQALDMDGVHLRSAEHPEINFAISDAQRGAIGRLLDEAGFDGVSANDLMEYLRAAAAGREYAKFVFTRSLSDILELVAQFGEEIGLSRTELSHVAIGDILRLGIESDSTNAEDRLRALASVGAEGHGTTIATRLPQLLYDEEGVHVVPFQVSHPNFITQGLVRAVCVRLRGDVNVLPPLAGKVVLIESADPGFDWIFAHNISGLITKFGGANSHMAIRCAEFDIPAAIGCGEQIFERIDAVGGVEINCGEGHVRAVRLV
jgi:hypothetical protein